MPNSDSAKNTTGIVGNAQCLRWSGDAEMRSANVHGWKANRTFQRSLCFGCSRFSCGMFYSLSSCPSSLSLFLIVIKKNIINNIKITSRVVCEPPWLHVIAQGGLWGGLWTPRESRLAAPPEQLVVGWMESDEVTLRWLVYWCCKGRDKDIYVFIYFSHSLPTVPCTLKKMLASNYYFKCLKIWSTIH